jgi:superoxide dismutase, Cu-Zn family
MRIPKIHRMLAALSLMGLTVAVVPASAAAYDDSRGATASVRDVNGVSLGTVVLQSSGGKIVVAGRLSGLTAGFHGFHIHTTGLCDPAGTVPFASAGGHLNPGGTGHGTHAGDLPLLKVAADGKTSTVTETDTVTFAQIFDADGSAIIIHAAPDNYANIPTRYSAAGVPGPDAATLATGDAGGRVACGVIRR